jgi:hypothetical protein
VTYCVRVTLASGRLRWLARGRMVTTREAATAYSSPSAARRSMDAFGEKHEGMSYMLDVLCGHNVVETRFNMDAERSHT